MATRRRGRARHPPPRPEARPAASAATGRVDRLKLRHLRALELVHRLGSLGAAARELRISQPTATMLLHELEEVFDAKLVDRGPRGARLTAVGLRALERLSIALVSVERGIEAAAAPDLAPVLRLGCVQTAGVRALPLALARLEQAGMPAPLELHEGRARDLVAALCAGRLDCVIGWMDETLASALPVGQLDIRPLWYGRMQVVAARGHPLARQRAVTVAELSRSRWIVPPAGSRTHAAYVRLFVGHGFAAPPVAVECAALHTALHLVAATRFLSVAPDAAVRAYAKRGMVVPLKGPELDLGSNPVSVMTRRDSDGVEAVGKLRDALLADAA